MADICLSIPHNKTKEELMEGISETINETASRLHIVADWKTDGVCAFSGPVKGTLKIEDEAVSVNLTLGFAARMFKGKIEERLREELERLVWARAL